MPFSAMNLLVGEILPRAMPVRSEIRHSTSVILRSFSQLVSWSNLVVIKTSGLRVRPQQPDSTLPRPLAAGLTESLEDSEIVGVRQNLPLRVPLHTKSEGFCTFYGDGFDQPVRRQCFYSKARRKTINALAMDGIDLELARQADTGEHSARLHMHGMARRVLNLERLVGRLAVVHEGSDLVHLLVQAAAESTFISWKPRQMPRTGMPASMAARTSGNVVASRSESWRVPGSLAGPL